MLDARNPQELIGAEAHSSDGEKIGRVGQVFLDDQTGQPEFITVNTGIFGTNESFVPIADATRTPEGLTVPFSKEKVKDAPNVSLDGGHMSEEEEQRLYEYYGIAYSRTQSDSGLPAGEETGLAAGTGQVPGAVGHDTSGPTTDEAMTRSQERLRVGTSSEESARVRLRKYVTTEEQTVTVPVTKEHAVLEREPITEANIDQAVSGPAISEEEHEVVLHEERPVVEKTVEPVERVRLGKEQVTEQQTVTEQVREEHIEAEGDVEDRR